MIKPRTCRNMLVPLIALVFFCISTLKSSRSTTSSFTRIPSSLFLPNVESTNCEVGVATSTSTIPKFEGYTPAPVEEFVMKNMVELGHDTQKRRFSSGCSVWGKNLTIQGDLTTYIDELDAYSKALEEFEGIGDLRLQGLAACNKVDLLKAHFPSRQLSRTSAGYVEPLLPPLRHPKCCTTQDGWNRNNFRLDLSYLVHDFSEMCKSLKRHSRVVLFDMGASLQFKGYNGGPPVYLYNLYRKFGFPFDHIYAYEVTPAPPAEVFAQLPPELSSAYHWINVGVNATVGSYLNPFTALLRDFTEDDLIIVKLDIDTPDLEIPLAHQLLSDPTLCKLVDQFYFEYHVHMEELRRPWGPSVRGSMKDSLDLFSELRKQGVAAHSWV